MYQEKYNKAFQDKAEMHELYLQEKQNVLEVKQELSKVQMEQQNQPAASTATAANLTASQNISDLTYQLKQGQETIQTLQNQIAELKFKKSQEYSDLNTQTKQDKTTIEEMKEKLQQAVMKMEWQRDQIKHSKFELRVMAGVLHRVGAEYCFSSRGGEQGLLGQNQTIIGPDGQPLVPGQLPNQ